MDDPGPARLVTLPEKLDERGSLAVIQAGSEVGFNINRVFYTYNVPPNAVRGKHAHQELHELIIALCGSFTVLVDDGKSRSTYVLDEPNLGLYVPPQNWIELYGFSPGAVCLVLASLPYDKADYYHNYDEFISEKMGTG